MICIHGWKRPRTRRSRLHVTSTYPRRLQGDLRATNRQDSIDAPAVAETSVSLRVSACVTFCPRRVENVRISVLPVCKYKRCCIQYTNALRSGRKFGLEFFPLHSEHPSLSTQIPPNTSTRVKVTTQTTPIQTHKERAPTEAIEPTHGETTDTGRGMQKEPTTVLSGLPNSRNTIIIQRDQKFHSSPPGTYPRGSPKTLPRGDIRG